MTEDIDLTEGAVPRRKHPVLRVLGRIFADVWSIFFGRADQWWAWGLVALGYVVVSVAAVMDGFDPVPIAANVTLFLLLTGFACFARLKWGDLPQ